MCLIIHKPKDVQIPTWIIASALLSNKDGFGIACNGQRERYAYASEAKAMARLNRPDELLVHFRMATAGIVAKGNTHPFALSDGSLLMHNGILPKKYQPARGLKAGESDTRVFIRSYLEPAIAKGAWPTLDAVEREIAGDKLAVMDKAARVTLYNAEDWVSYEGLRLSNTYAWDAPDELLPARERWTKYLPAKFSKWYDERGSAALYTGEYDGAMRDAGEIDRAAEAQYADTSEAAADLYDSITDAIIEREDDVDWRAALYAVDIEDAALIDGIIDAELTVFDFCRKASAQSLLMVYQDLVAKRVV